MAVAVTQENGRIKVEWLIRWYTRLSSLPLLAASLFFGFAAAEIAQRDLFGYGRVRDDWLSFVLCIVFALCLGLPGLALAMLATSSSSTRSCSKSSSPGSSGR